MCAVCLAYFHFLFTLLAQEGDIKWQSCPNLGQSPVFHNTTSMPSLDIDHVAFLHLNPTRLLGFSRLGY